MVKLVMRNIANAGYVLGKKALGKLKVPENYFEVKAEGYDGHLEWEGNTERVLCMKYEFYEKILRFRESGDDREIMEVFDSLGIAASDVQMEYLCKLLQAPKSAEMTKEALMIAICIGSRPLVELILSLFRDFPHEERSGCSNSPGFLPHITPLMLACILNNFSIVQCLLLRGHSIDLPHHVTCKCVVCLRMSNNNMDGLRRVDALRAVSSEAFLWLATDDPFAAACSLSQDLAICMKNDNFEFMDTYRVLYNNIQRFTCRIIENNWRVEELDIFLAHKCHCSLSACAAPYPRIQLALEARMRHFAGSPNVQRAMSCIWWRGWGNFGTNPARDSYRVLRHVFLYPILALLYIFSNGKLASSFDVPLARYISYMSSYATFVACLIVIRFAKIGEQAKTAHTPRGYPFGIAIEAYCYLYILGLMLERYIQFSRFGFRNYFAFWWRWFDFLLIGSFCLAFHLWICGVLMPMEPDLELLSRIHWPAWDYFLIYDIYLCTGCILGFWRVFYFFQLIKGIGGSVISVGSCISTIYNYLVVMGVVMLSFAVGVNLLVQPYLNSVVVKEDGTQEAMNTRFGTIFSTIRNMYWAVYGYLDPSVYPTVNGNSGPDQAPVDHYLTSFATELLLTIYHCIIVIILLNLMVSLLVKKADEVLENEESEFKYTRIVIYSEYFAWSSSVPPPFNLLYVIKEALWKFFVDDKITVSWPEIWTERELIKPDHETCSKDCNTYNNLMMTLFSRFRASKECHYRSIFRTEFDKDRATAESAAKVAFMNSFNDRYEAFQWNPPQLTAATPTPRAVQ
uniref:Ion_trans domain-containing protein n=1 Tax=Haemonchus contortus TaxID=6289 RepID=A0A7I4YRU2_HAECO